MKKIILFSLVIFSYTIFSQVSTVWVSTDTISKLKSLSQSIAVDNVGNSYVACDTIVGMYSTTNKAKIAKFDNNGNLVWTKILAGVNDTSYSGGSFVAIDKAGSIYLAGTLRLINKPTINADFFLAKYNSSGALQWAINYDDSLNRDNELQDLEIDPFGNILMVGMTSGGSKFTCVKYNNSGIKLWDRVYESLSYPYGSFYAVDYDAVGDIYAVGRIDTSIVTFKYSSSGNLMWLKKYGAKTHGGVVGSYGSDIDVDARGNVYVTSSRAAIWWDYAVLSYDINGNLNWATIVDGPGSYQDYPISIKGDDFGNVYVTGMTYLLAPNTCYYPHVYTFKLNGSGLFAWGDMPNFADKMGTYHFERSSGMQLDSIGNIYVGQYSNNSAFIVKYDATGLTKWTATHYSQRTGLGGNSAAFFDIRLDKKLDVYAAGGIQSGNLIVKYCQNTCLTSINEIEDPKQDLHVYPNPTSGKITLNSEEDLGLITISNSLGEIILQKICKSNDEQIDISRFSSGIYTINFLGGHVKIVKD